MGASIKTEEKRGKAKWKEHAWNWKKSCILKWFGLVYLFLLFYYCLHVYIKDKKHENYRRERRDKNT